MNDLRAAAQLALEALESVLCDPEGRACIRGSDEDLEIINGALRALRAALAQPQPEHKTGCALLQIPSRECDCGAESAPVPVQRSQDWHDGVLEGQLREREQWLAQPAPEPVAWMSDSDVGFDRSEFGATQTVPLYTAPPQRKPLTEEEVYSRLWIASAIERAHNIKE